MAAKVDTTPRVGADPELFVKKSSGGPIIPICGLVGGTKEKPINITKEIIKQYGNGVVKGAVGDYALQEDNVMLEFNIPAFTTTEMFARGISYTLEYLEQHVLSNKELIIQYGVPAYNFKAAVLDMYPQSQTIGCLSDMDAYAEPGRFARVPYTAQDFGTQRFCGGHLHIQYNKAAVPEHIFAQFMDVVTSLAYLSWDKQKPRRKFYGKAGLYRPKSYGIEYRTLSSFWLKSEFRRDNLYGMIENVLQLARSTNNAEPMLKAAYRAIPWSEVKKTIEEEDFKAAAELVLHIQRNTGLAMNSSYHGEE